MHINIMTTLQTSLAEILMLQFPWEGTRERLNTRIYRHVPQIADQLFTVISSTIARNLVRLSSSSSTLVVGIVGELPSYSADSIRLRYSEKVSKCRGNQVRAWLSDREVDFNE